MSRATWCLTRASPPCGLTGLQAARRCGCCLRAPPPMLATAEGYYLPLSIRPFSGDSSNFSPPEEGVRRSGQPVQRGQGGGRGPQDRTRGRILPPKPYLPVFNVSDVGNEWDRMLSHRRLSAALPDRSASATAGRPCRPIGPIQNSYLTCTAKVQSSLALAMLPNTPKTPVRVRLLLMIQLVEKACQACSRPTSPGI